MGKRSLVSSLVVSALVLVPDVSPAQIAVISPMTEERQAEPGETYTGTVLVRNTTAEPQEARIYQTDYAYFADGRVEFGEPGALARSNASWVTFAPSRVALRPGEVVEVSYSVHVPADAGGRLGGTYWSVLMVESVGPEASGSSGTAGQERVRMGVSTKLRYAVQLVTHIDGTGVRRAELEGARVVATADGGRVLEFDVVNTGDLSYRLDISLELYDANGAAVGRYEDQRGLLYPGSSLRQRFDLTDIPSGTYTVLVVADTGSDDVFGAQYTLKL
ncbi:MAG TPA: hypothetical protein VF212_05530 [Longimicrobiales bacterium]